MLTWTKAVLWEYGPLFKGESQGLYKYVHVCRLEWLYVSSTEAVCIFCVRIFVACSDVSQSHEASPLAIQQSFNPHHQWPQTPASGLSVHTDTQSPMHKRPHTLMPPVPLPLALTSVDLYSSLKHKGKECHLLCCCLRQPTITLTFFLRRLSNGNTTMIYPWFPSSTKVSFTCQVRERFPNFWYIPRSMVCACIMCNTFPLLNIPGNVWMVEIGKDRKMVCITKVYVYMCVCADTQAKELSFSVFRKLYTSTYCRQTQTHTHILSVLVWSEELVRHNGF